MQRSGSIDLDRPALVGILNITPDSFSDGGRFDRPGVALEHAVRLVEDGAAMIDVGGESTRPGAVPVDAATELARFLPVIRVLRAHLSVPISIDTRHAQVARAAIDEGADVVNDISSLGDDDMAGVVASAGAGLVLMHMRGTPQTMQDDPRYDDVSDEVTRGLALAVAKAMEAGVSPEQLVVDPGIGFGKSFEHNLELMMRLGELTELGRPIMLGASRKAFLGKILGGARPEDRDVATAAACVVGLLNGARLFRVHAVRPVRESLLVADALRRASPMFS
jgi:dihydropteroate synthase